MRRRPAATPRTRRGRSPVAGPERVRDEDPEGTDERMAWRRDQAREPSEKLDGFHQQVGLVAAGVLDAIGHTTLLDGELADVELTSYDFAVNGDDGFWKC